MSPGESLIVDSAEVNASKVFKSRDNALADAKAFAAARAKTDADAAKAAAAAAEADDEGAEG